MTKLILLTIFISHVVLAQFDSLFWEHNFNSPPKDTTVIVYDEYAAKCDDVSPKQFSPLVRIDTIGIIGPKLLDKAPYPSEGLSAFASSIAYPEIARRAGVEGDLLLTATIDKDGKPKNIKVKKSNAEVFNETALTSLRITQFSPAVKSGYPIEAEVAILISFRLKGQTHVVKTNVPIDQIIIHKGPCFGTCESYQITLNRTGEVTYVGFYYVARLGEWRASLQNNEFDEIASLIYAIRFFTLKEWYTNHASDESTVTIVVKVGNETKEVSSDPGCYYPLWAIASLVEHLTDKLNWKQIVK